MTIPGSETAAARHLSEPSDTLPAKELLQKAYLLTRESKLDSAIATYRLAAADADAHEDWGSFAYAMNGLGYAFYTTARFNEARDALQAALKVEGLMGGEGELLRAQTYALLAQIDLYEERMDSARENARAGLSIRQRLLGEAHLQTAASLYTLGIVFRKVGQYDSAYACLTAAARIQCEHRNENPQDLASTLIALGMVCDARSEYEESLTAFRSVIDLLMATGKELTPWGGMAHGHAGVAYGNLGMHHEAVRSYLQAIRIQRQFYGDTSVSVAGFYARLGEEYANAGDYEKALEHCFWALNVLSTRGAHNQSGIAELNRLIGNVYAEMGDLERAEEHINKALSIKKTVLGERHPDIGFCYQDLGNILVRLGEFNKGIAAYRQALDIRSNVHSAPGRYDIAQLYAKLGAAFTGMQIPDSALLYLCRAEEELGSTFPDSKQLGLETLVSKLPATEHLGVETSVSSLRPSKHLGLQTPGESCPTNASLRAAMSEGRGSAYSLKGMLEESAICYHEAAIALCRAFSDHDLVANPTADEAAAGPALVRVLCGKARALEGLSASGKGSLNTKRSALWAYESASRIGTRLMTVVTTERSKLQQLSNLTAVRESGIRVALQLYRMTGEQDALERAFTFAEEHRASVLQESFRQQQALHVAGIPDSLLDHERILRESIISCRTQVDKESEAGHPNPARIRKLRDRVFLLSRQHDSLLELFEHSYPAYYRMVYDDTPLAVGEVQRRLGKDDALLEYYLGEAASYVFILRQNSLDVATLSPLGEIEAAASEFRSGIITMGKGAYVSAAARLYSLVMRPAEHHVRGKHRLVIVPDGVLHQVPFEAFLVEPLRNPPAQAAGIDFTRLPYLITQHEVSYFYSARFFLDTGRWGSGTAHHPKAFGGFAPVFSDSGSRRTIPPGSLFADAKDEGRFRSVTLDGRSFNELRHSEEEVEEIGAGFRLHGIPAAGFYYEGATEQNFKESCAGFSHIHIATHGLMNAEHPDLSALVFSPGSDSTGEDGILHGGEVFALRLNADLLVLSCCESGLGKIVKGEGAMALTRGFLYAGARNIVYSLWKVYDNHTSKLMKEFYGDVLAGSAYTSALRTAKLRMIRRQATAFPLKWAGFVLLGE